mmetsp:Transcript_20427/g.60294  ORF Transcript_20427/g.60294 Transcript_20427/m.60294 type:complete len:374 (+) Transcript_20427:532-1653(+)
MVDVKGVAKVHAIVHREPDAHDEAGEADAVEGDAEHVEDAEEVDVDARNADGDPRRHHRGREEDDDDENGEAGEAHVAQHNLPDHRIELVREEDHRVDEAVEAAAREHGLELIASSDGVQALVGDGALDRDEVADGDWVLAVVVVQRIDIPREGWRVLARHLLAEAGEAILVQEGAQLVRVLLPAQVVVLAVALEPVGVLRVPHALPGDDHHVVLAAHLRDAVADELHGAAVGEARVAHHDVRADARAPKSSLLEFKGGLEEGVVGHHVRVVQAQVEEGRASGRERAEDDEDCDHRGGDGGLEERWGVRVAHEALDGPVALVRRLVHGRALGDGRVRRVVEAARAARAARRAHAREEAHAPGDEAPLVEHEHG